MSWGGIHEDRDEANTSAHGKKKCWKYDVFLYPFFCIGMNFRTDRMVSQSFTRLRVVPLFETVKDLREAGSVIRKLLSIDWYHDHVIKNHNGHQEV